MKTNYGLALLLLSISFIIIISITAQETVSTPVLNAVVVRDQLRCGISGQALGFSYRDANEDYAGFDVDLCRAIAAAILGDSSKVAFVELSSSSDERSQAISENCGNICVDVLTLNVTWTMSREIEWEAIFAPTTFYDGQDIMVLEESGIRTLRDLEGGIVCATGEGTTTVANLEDIKDDYGFSVLEIPSGEFIDVYLNFVQGKCSAISSDRSELISFRGWSERLANAQIARFSEPNTSTSLPLEFAELLDQWWYFPRANDLRVLNAEHRGRPLSEEPLGAVSSQRDPVFADAIRWTIYGMIHAERLGISKSSFDVSTSACTYTPPLALTTEAAADIDRLLGPVQGFVDEAELNDVFKRGFMVDVICQVGNYGDIYNANLGSSSELGIDRNLTKNQLWPKGLLYAPPF